MWHGEKVHYSIERKRTLLCSVFLLYSFREVPIDSFQSISSVFSRLYSYLGGAGPACADVTGPEHLLVAQDTTAGVLLAVQELLEVAESVLGVGGAGDLLQQPADLVRIVFHLEKEEDEDMTGGMETGAGSGREKGDG